MRQPPLKIILGSSSLGRRGVLERLGWNFEVMPANVNEKAIRHQDPRKLTLLLANAKADALLQKISEPAILITSDTIVWCNGMMREKPRSEKEARAFLESYAQHPADVITAVVAINTATQKRAESPQSVRIFFKPTITTAIDVHIKNGNALRGAGGFVIEDPVLEPHIDHIEGTRDAVIGLDPRILEKLIAQIL